jgi:predicted RNase H-like HicB family nuclease
MRKPSVAKTRRSARRYRFAVVVVKEGRGHWAYVPDLPGVYGRGGTPTAAKHDLLEALTLYVEDCLAAGDPVPKSAAQIVNVSTLSLAIGA